MEKQAAEEISGGLKTQGLVACRAALVTARLALLVTTRLALKEMKAAADTNFARYTEEAYSHEHTRLALAEKDVVIEELRAEVKAYFIDMIAQRKKYDALRESHEKELKEMASFAINFHRSAQDVGETYWDTDIITTAFLARKEKP